MSILHTINTSPFQTHALQQCLSLFSEQDSLLLIEDAVIAVQAKHSLFAQLQRIDQAGRLMVLTSDLEARGIENKIGKSCSYTDFVDLIVSHNSQMAW
ncbi:sulfurtransferase complex subunit TusB [Psychromonas sp. psych-6C06]|uniref:sulfurtransferase complex subunit TusB n=1 Tax=Psychromonas sp. psych-6C06 TaxID=2058089 RepID=UPI000C3474B4|nr:sulfurtransferase complex subunit TusB [Psychromonas sp. psych-6C06]PKF60309.1 sulfurtransferase complex subunit TusB [Psychromonas sp. psych-6C06]